MAEKLIEGVTIRRTKGGATISAKGDAAQRLFDAMTKAPPMPPASPDRELLISAVRTALKYMRSPKFDPSMREGIAVVLEAALHNVGAGK